MARLHTLHLVRLSILITAVALMIGSAVRPAMANQHGVDVNAANSFANLCGWMGGAGDQTPNRYPDGIRSITVKCKGGGLNGLTCNYSRYGLMCWWPMASIGNGQADEVLPTFETVGEIAPVAADLPELAPEIELIDDVEPSFPPADEPVADGTDLDEPVVDPAPTIDESVDPGVADPVVENGQDVGSDAGNDPYAEPTDEDLPTFDETVEPVTDGEIVAEPVAEEAVIVEEVAVAAPSGGEYAEIVDVEEKQG